MRTVDRHHYVVFYMYTMLKQAKNMHYRFSALSLLQGSVVRVQTLAAAAGVNMIHDDKSSLQTKSAVEFHHAETRCMLQCKISFGITTISHFI